jgi:hypothetical protein
MTETTSDPQRGADTLDEAPSKTTRVFPFPLTILVLDSHCSLACRLLYSVGVIRDERGRSADTGTFSTIESPLDFGDMVAELLIAPVNGVYGTQDPNAGMVSPFNAGIMSARLRPSCTSWL